MRAAGIFLCLGSCFLALASPAIAASRNDELRAAALVERLGGTLERDASFAGNPIVKIDLHESAVRDDDLAVIGRLDELRHLDLRKTRVGHEGVSHLRRLERLVFLNLFRTRLGDRGLQSLKRLERLETLLVGGTRISDRGLRHVRGFARLRKLSVFDTQVGDTGVLELRGLPSLEVVLLEKSRVTLAGRSALAAAIPGIRFTEPT